MFSISVRKLDSLGGGFLASRKMGKSVQGGSLFTPSLKHYDIATSYTINEGNGTPPTTVNVNFPSDKYTALDYTPVWEHHRFAGWYSTSVPENTSDFVAERYRLLDYIYSTGTQYINTGIHTVTPFVVEIKFSISPNGATNDSLFGTFVSNNRVWLLLTKLENGKNRILATSCRDVVEEYLSNNQHLDEVVEDNQRLVVEG